MWNEKEKPKKGTGTRKIAQTVKLTRGNRPTNLHIEKRVKKCR